MGGRPTWKVYLELLQKMASHSPATIPGTANEQGGGMSARALTKANIAQLRTACIHRLESPFVEKAFTKANGGNV
jgi:hypothetical protein